jgi:hypothetical protein
MTRRRAHCRPPSHRGERVGEGAWQTTRHGNASPTSTKTATEDHRRNSRDVREPGREAQKGRKWLAAQAIQRVFRLLTANAKDFADIPGLKSVVPKVP